MTRPVPLAALVAAAVAIAPAAAWEAPRHHLGGAVLLTEVLYEASLGDEFITLTSTTGAPVALAGWTLSDGEGRVHLPDVLLQPGASITITENSTAYVMETLEPADYTWRDGAAPLLAVSGSFPFQLANDGDALTLEDSVGLVVDAFVWGDASYSGPGWLDPIHLNGTRGQVFTRARDGAWVDTDTSADWRALAPRLIGQSDFAVAAYTVSGNVEAFASPGRSREVLIGHLDGAATSIRLAVYQLTSLAVERALLDARGRGVEVSVLLEGAPVGGIDEREWGIAGNLSAAGIAVRFLDAGNRTNYATRYATLHAKYVVIDDHLTVVSSENLGDTGFPPFGRRGNRGWSVAIRDAAVAGHFARVFDNDFDPRRLDSIPYAAMAVTPVPYLADAAGAYPWTVEPASFPGPHRVTPVIGPENAFSSETILGLLRSATTRLYIEQFYAHRLWDGSPNLFIQEAVNASRRGVDVKILLDATWYNTDPSDPNDNDDTVANLTAIALAEGLPLQAKLAKPVLHDVIKYHNKGIVVDGERVLVSSFNWNLFSPARNREVGVIIESPGVAGFFEELFVHDWKDDWTPPVAVIYAQDRVDVNEALPLAGSGSTDDGVVTNWSWDLDGDGAFDAYGDIVTTAYPAVGNYTVRLLVRDAWGNEDEATHRLRVALPEPPPPPPPPPEFSWPLLLLAATGFALVLLLSFVYRRRRA